MTSLTLTTPDGRRIGLRPGSEIDQMPRNRAVVVMTEDCDVYEGYCPFGGEVFELDVLRDGEKFEPDRPLGGFILMRKRELPPSAGRKRCAGEPQYLTCLVYVDAILGWELGEEGGIEEDAEIINEILTKEKLKRK